MSVFHDEEDGVQEPIEGLPEALPEGEDVLWRGKPGALTFAIHALHIRLVAAYFAVMAGWRMAAHAAQGGDATAIMGVALSSLTALALAMGLLCLLAWLMSRATVYTITNRRVVLRYGVAIRKYVNLPFPKLAAVSLKRHGQGAGDIALEIEAPGRVGYLHLWPHVRPFRFSNAQPMLRAIPDVDAAADTLCKAMTAHAPTQFAAQSAAPEKRLDAPGAAEAMSPA